MKNRLVDPVHFFDHRGLSTMTHDHLLDEIEARDQEIERLTRLLEAARRQRQRTDESVDD